jgi:hypothetical protein
MQNLLLRYEREEGDRLSGTEKAQVDEALATIREFVGVLRIAVSDPGATVAVDGETIGTSPLSEPIDLELGKHKVSVNKTGFEPYEHTLEIAGGNESSLTVILVVRHELAHLAVTGEVGSFVFVDRKAVGRDAFEGTVNAGAHEIQVTAPGKRAYSSVLDLRPGETRSIQVMLPVDSRGPTVWPWVALGVAVVAGAAVGAYFIFQPHDERGPVPSTTLGAVDAR